MDIFTYHQSQASCHLDLMTYSTMIKGFCKFGHLESALTLLDAMRHSSTTQPDEILYNSLLDGCSKAGKLDLAFQLYNQMQAEGSGIIPTTVTFNSLIDACVRADQLQEGWRVLRSMEEMGVQADNYTYSTLFKGIKHETQQADLDQAF